ncbi:MAG: hypothetical protein JWM99_4191, partial [Verrucomicrobiales bacterium]|nr:hypothetical protein [Verrucomicrobiales bacterium]
MDTETGGDTAPRESTPALKPEENREHGSAGHREDEEHKHASQSRDLHRDDLPERNRHREARAESSVEEPVFERESRMDRQSDPERQNGREDNEGQVEGSAAEQ